MWGWAAQQGERPQCSAAIPNLLPAPSQPRSSTLLRPHTPHLSPNQAEVKVLVSEIAAIPTSEATALEVSEGGCSRAQCSTRT